MDKISTSKFQKYENHIILTIAILIALYVRFSLRHFESRDFKVFLEPWHNFIIQHGGGNALKYNFSNYNVPYLYLMVIGTYIFSGLSKVFAIKLISIVFDFVCAFFVYNLVHLKYPVCKLPIIAFITVLFAPTTFLNSSYWAQCDIIYTPGLVACIYFLCIQKKIMAFVSFGLAFSFKLQALFMTPFLLLLLLKKSVSWKSFILIPAVYLVTILPAWFIGRPISDLLLVYLEQTSRKKLLVQNAPNLYQFIPIALRGESYTIFLIMGLLLTLTALFMLLVSVYKSRANVSKELIIQLALTVALLVPYLLPKMHERYFFGADIISIIYGYYFPIYFFVPITIGMVSLFSYFPFLINMTIVSLKVLAIILGFTIIIVFHHLAQTLRLEGG